MGEDQSTQDQRVDVTDEDVEKARKAHEASTRRPVERGASDDDKPAAKKTAAKKTAD